jgi:hypothetical protein
VRNDPEDCRSDLLLFFPLHTELCIGSHALSRNNCDVAAEMQILSLELASGHPSGAPNLEEASRFLDKFVYPLPHLKYSATLLLNRSYPSLDSR